MSDDDPTQRQCACGAEPPEEGMACARCGRVRVRTRILAGKWRVEARLGSGGMGSVVLATDLALGRRVAIKVLHPALANDASFVARFKREARVMARLDHPGIVPIYGIEETPEGLLLVMKHIEGVTLSAHLKARGRLGVRETLDLLGQLCDAVGAMHRRGLVHRDLKPSNCIVQADGRLVLLDFGLARHDRESVRLTEPGTAMGSGAYMAPEQARDEAIDQRSDLYALAVMAFECLTGRTPFVGEPMVALLQRLNADPPLATDFAPELPAELARALARGMARAPDARPTELDQFLAELKRASAPAGFGAEERTVADERRRLEAPDGGVTQPASRPPK